MSAERWYIVGTVIPTSGHEYVLVETKAYPGYTWYYIDGGEGAVFPSYERAQEAFAARPDALPDDAIVTGDEYDALVAADRARQALG